MEDAMAKVTTTAVEAEDIMQLIGFEIAEEFFGVDILMVQEILKDITITAIPDSPDFIKGVVNLRGNIIPVIDLKKRLKLSVSTANDDALWILILNIGGRVTGFVVDRVTRVIKIQTKSIKPPPELMISGGLESDYVRGVCKQDKRILAILDFNRILLVDEFKKLNVDNKKNRQK